MKLNKSKKGISLIVLVITIVVMIILAATIILALNSNNIVGRAHEAKTSSDESMIKEAATVHLGEYNIKVAKKKIDPSEISADEYVKKELKEKGLDTSNLVITQQGNIYILNKTIARLKEEGKVEIKVSKTGAINVLYTDKNDDTALIPEGFVPSEATGENTIEYGLVIYDGDEAVTDDNVEVARETRNQFVWIPVPNFEKFERTTTYDGVTITPPSDVCEEPYSDNNTLSLTNDPTGEWAEWTNMRLSVQEYGGFYIGRYEAGTTNPRTSSAVTDVLVQKNKPVYNRVGWGSSIKKVGTKGAVYLSRNLYNTASVMSTLCYGVQWDAALIFINKNDSKYAKDSTNKGNYSGTLLETGLNEEYAFNNIYDMAGNAVEITMETFTSYEEHIFRGGTYGENGKSVPAGYRELYRASFYFYEWHGFRIALYIK